MNSSVEQPGVPMRFTINTVNAAAVIYSENRFSSCYVSYIYIYMYVYHNATGDNTGYKRTPNSFQLPANCPLFLWLTSDQFPLRFRGKVTRRFVALDGWILDLSEGVFLVRRSVMLLRDRWTPSRNFRGRPVKGGSNWDIGLLWRSVVCDIVLTCISMYFDRYSSEIWKFLFHFWPEIRFLIVASRLRLAIGSW